MPIYEMFCRTCNATDDVICKYEERASLTCATCGNPYAGVIPGAVRTVGITFSNAVDLNVGLPRGQRKAQNVITSNAQMRRFQAQEAARGITYVPRDSREWKESLRESDDAADRQAVELGYADDAERQKILTATKRAKKRGESGPKHRGFR